MFQITQHGKVRIDSGAKNVAMTDFIIGVKEVAIHRLVTTEIKQQQFPLVISDKVSSNSVQTDDQITSSVSTIGCEPQKFNRDTFKLG